MNHFLTSLQNHTTTKIVVFSSSTPNFWAAHIDTNIFTPQASSYLNSTLVFEQYNQNLDLLSTTPVVFIAEINGRTWGAGDEHQLRMDMRFAGPEAIFGAPETALGVIHVGAMQQLVHLIGPGRAAEYMTSAAQVDATEAARVGWVNRAYPSEEALREGVDAIAQRIALFSIDALVATKASIAEQAAPPEAYLRDQERFNALASTKAVQSNIAQFLEVSKNQSEAFELDVDDNIVEELY